MGEIARNLTGNLERHGEYESISRNSQVFQACPLLPGNINIIGDKNNIRNYKRLSLIILILQGDFRRYTRVY